VNLALTHAQAVNAAQSTADQAEIQLTATTTATIVHRATQSTMAMVTEIIVLVATAPAANPVIKTQTPEPLISNQL